MPPSIQLSAQQMLTAISAVDTDPLLLFDPDWRLIWANAAAYALLGMREAQVGHLAQECLQVPELLAFMQKGARLPEWIFREMYFVPRMVSLPADSQEVTAIHALILRDVTPIRKLSYNQHEFIRIVSHDLRSPITSMSGFISMLAQGVVGNLTEQQALFVDKVASGIQQITSLVENIQDAGRFDPETGFYEMQRTACDLNDIARRVADEHLIPAEKGELTIAVETSPRMPILNVDANMIERAIVNLVDNAIKFTPNGGRITVITDADADGAWVGVRDTGYGIPPDQQPLLFKRHVRLTRAEHKRVKGSGLGLFIVRSVAQRHSGEAWVESETGKGSTFFLRVPIDDQSRLF